MKIARLAFCLNAALAAGSAFAADDLFTATSNREQFIAPGEMLAKVAQDPTNERIELVRANAGLISAKTRDLRLSLPGGLSITALQSHFETMASGNDVWIGELDVAATKGLDSKGRQALDANENTIIAVRSGDTILANIRVNGELYRLVPVDKGQHALIEVDQSKFLPDEDEAAYAEMSRHAPPPRAMDRNWVESGAKAISTIRVMVAFGPAAGSAIGNDQQTVDLAFTESNNALAATNTDIRFQQAGAIQYYTQSETSNYTTMLSRLTNGSDGFYDAIAGQRNTNTADIVAYVAPASSSLCGQAAGIATSNASAYFVMSPSCMTGNYTFVHEAGHVIGTRHDNDSTTTPYAYGHGYVMSSISRRTVMAVNNGPCPSCTRIGAFSSPNYTLSGVAIGTANYNDNTRVLRTRGPTVAAFR